MQDVYIIQHLTLLLGAALTFIGSLAQPPIQNATPPVSPHIPPEYIPSHHYDKWLNVFRAEHSKMSCLKPENHLTIKQKFKIFGSQYFHLSPSNSNIILGDAEFELENFHQAICNYTMSFFICDFP